MTDVQQRKSAAKFADEWQGRGYEKGESQPFWLALLRDVFGVEQPENYITFEDTVRLDHTSFIDGIIAETHVLIEQKSLGKDLLAPIKQSDGTFLTPFQQAKRYSSELPYSERPRWIVTCNFGEFLIYDMEKPQGEPERILLEDLPDEYHRLNFLVDTRSVQIKKEMEISFKAGEIIGALYDEILAQYKDTDSAETLRSLNILCVRLVFCLYAEDAGIFGHRTQFHDYLKSVADKDIEDVRVALIRLFKVLNQQDKERDPYENDILLAFPYVNGGLFDEENIAIPRFNEKIVELLLKNASEDFDWSGISPTIFGALFESTLNPATRRTGGMHYTSIENIHKVIDPLFLDELKAELTEIKAKKQRTAKQNSLKAFQEKLANLSFLDPACGSGNFLTETYLSLRTLENEVLKLLNADGQITIDDSIIKVSIGQFYGIEINDFAVSVAKTALWIAESQMMKKTEDIVSMSLDFLPLKSYANIIEGNALRIDWEEVVCKEELDYIMGNPPFVGARMMNSEQKSEVHCVFGKLKGVGSLDYVSAWYKKAVDYTENTNIKCAFVSTNSVSQGEQPAILWKPLLERGIHINFGVPAFKWDSKTIMGKAAVHCVIVGFSYIKTENDLNQYLLKAPTVFIERRSTPICDIAKMEFGNMPNDGKGLLSNYSTVQKKEIVKKFPETKKWFKKFLGAEEFINNIDRWCLWLKDVSPSEIAKSAFMKDILAKVKSEREKSSREATRRLADTPYLFGEIRQPITPYLLIPRVSSERRKYIPIGFLSSDVIVSDANLFVSRANLYLFGILTSSVHMAWVRTVCGRLEMRYRYSKDIVYNNFPWAGVTNSQKSEIEKLAQGVLDARAIYPDSSLADLYDPLTMPVELTKAHKALDRAVMKLYGFGRETTEAEIVAGLMERYRELVGGGLERCVIV